MISYIDNKCKLEVWNEKEEEWNRSKLEDVTCNFLKKQKSTCHIDTCMPLKMKTDDVGFIIDLPKFWKIMLCDQAWKKYWTCDIGLEQCYPYTVSFNKCRLG